MRALDLFCGAGGAGKGLLDAGFDEVVGWDTQDFAKRYPGTFNQGDALFLPISYIREFDFVWSSPPCQLYSKGTHASGTHANHLNLIPATRTLLLAADVPFVMENVVDSPLRYDLFLCGLMFPDELPQLQRHRYFEIEGFECARIVHPIHEPGAAYVTVAGHTGIQNNRSGNRGLGLISDWKRAMGIDWMTAKQLAQAVPPTYSRYIANQFFLDTRRKMGA